MPSAQTLELDEPASGQTEPDLYALLREIKASNVRSFNALHPRGKSLLA